MQPTDINAGKYSGRITTVLDHYAVQRVSATQRVFHDLTLAKVKQKAVMRINYSQGVSQLKTERKRQRGMEL